MRRTADLGRVGIVLPYRPFTCARVYVPYVETLPTLPKPRIAGSETLTAEPAL
jgi:hypothetical protein